MDEWSKLWETATYEEDGSVGFGPDLDELKKIGDDLQKKLRAVRRIVETAKRDNAARSSYAYYVVEEILEVLR